MQFPESVNRISESRYVERERTDLLSNTLNEKELNMGFWEKLEQFNLAIEKVQDLLDDSPINLCLSYDEILKEKIKSVLTKYALYDEVNVRDFGFNGFGLLEIEFVGKEPELDNFKIVVEKVVFDYLRSYYLNFTRTKTDVYKISENIYSVRVYYSFTKKTLRNFELYFSEISGYKKQEILEKETIKDEELEREIREWKIE